MSTGATLLGRAPELAVLHTFMTDLTAGAGTILLRGPAGIGKTSLLDVVASHPARILRPVVSGPSPALTHLLGPLEFHFAALDPGHQAALRAVVDGRDRPGHFTLSAAVTALLRHVASSGPLLIILDDLHTMDDDSAAVLAFAARRCRGRPLGILGAARSGYEGELSTVAGRLLDLAPLDDSAVFALITHLAPDAAITVRRRVAEDAAGNPAAIIAFLRELTGEQLRVQRSLPPVLAAPADALEPFRSRLAELPRSARFLLLLAALEGTGDPRILSAGADLAVVENAGLLAVDRDHRRLRFGHPLVPSAVVAHAGPEEQRRAHRRLARMFADAPDVRLRHATAALARPDAAVATRLEQAGLRSLARGEMVTASADFLRAAELSGSDRQRRRLLSQAGLASVDALRLIPRADLLMATAVEADRDPDAALAAALLGGYASMLASGDPAEALAGLAGAAKSLPPPAGGDPARRFVADQAAWAMAHLVHLLGPPRQATFAATLDRLGPSLTPAVEAQVRLFNDPAHVTGEQRAMLDRGIAELPNAAPSDAVRTGMAAMFVDRVDECRDALDLAIRDAERNSASFLASHAHTMLAFADFRAGEWDAAANRSEADFLFQGHPLAALGAYLVRVLVDGLRGATVTTEAILRGFTERATRAGQAGVVERVAWAGALLSLSAGDAETAYQRLTARFPAGVLPHGKPYALWSVLDLTEAAVRSGRPEVAARHARAVVATGCAGWSPRMAFLASASTAMAGAGTDVLADYETALDAGRGRWPLDEARVRFAYGEALAARRSVPAATSQLLAARDLLHGLGAGSWAQQVSTRLATLSLTAARSDGLTARERRIADLAAAGLSNREIAARLLLSPRTVGAHLYRIFPKLGVDSRVSLRAALREYDSRAGRGSAA